MHPKAKPSVPWRKIGFTALSAAVCAVAGWGAVALFQYLASVPPTIDRLVASTQKQASDNVAILKSIDEVKDNQRESSMKMDRQAEEFSVQSNTINQIYRLLSERRVGMAQ